GRQPGEGHGRGRLENQVRRLCPTVHGAHLVTRPENNTFLNFLTSCGPKPFVGPVEGEISGEIRVVIHLGDAYLTALEKFTAEPLGGLHGPIRLLAILPQQPLLSDGCVPGVAIEGVKECGRKAITRRGSAFESCVILFGPTLLQNQAMQTVALHWWHEVRPLVSSSTTPLILHDDEGQQRKQHCSDNTAGYASAGMLCGRHGSVGRRGLRSANR